MIRIDTLGNDKEFLTALTKHFPKLQWIPNNPYSDRCVLCSNCSADSAHELLEYMEENYETPETHLWELDSRYNELFDCEDFFLYLTKIKP
jgi:hypothetical protein